MTALAALYEPPCLIGGEEHRGAGQIDVTYPYKGELVGAAPLLRREQVRHALDLAGAARVSLDRYERSVVLDRVAGAIEDARDELAILITLESGLCLSDTHHEVARAVDVFRFASREALRDDGQVWACDISPNGRPRRAITSREPLRLVAAVTPFNHPLNQVAH